MQAPLLSPRAFPSTNSSPFSSNQSSSENIKSRDHLFLSGNLSPAAVASVAFDGPSRLDDKDPAADGANMNGVSPFEAIRSKFALFDRMEDERKNLFQDMLERLQAAETELSRSRFDLADAKESRYRYQQQVQKVNSDLQAKNSELESFARKLNRSAYAVVLIDGDGAKFADEFFRNINPSYNAPGAAEAAGRLKQNVLDYLEKHNPELDVRSMPVLVKIFSHMDGLATTLRCDDILPPSKDASRDALRTFVAEFNKSRAEFDFIDVGKGKENADAKIRKQLEFFYKQPTCKKIFFAGCHDTGYRHELNQLRGDLDADKLVLLETTPAEPCYRQLGFPIIRFDDVFRSTPMSNETKNGRPVGRQAPAGHSPPSAYAVPSQLGNVFNKPASPTMARPSLYASTSGSYDQANGGSAAHISPVQRPTPPPATPSSTASATPLPIRTTASASVHDSGNGGLSVKHPASYAKVGGDENWQNVSVKPKKPVLPKMIYYNHDNVRLDPPPNFPGLSHPAQATYNEKLDVLRSKGKVFCNDFYLIGKCRYPDTCNRSHAISLTPEELAIHRYKARTSPCTNGPGCENYDCYLSHHCPGKDGRCTRLPHCKFAIHLRTAEDYTPVDRWTEGDRFPEHLPEGAKPHWVEGY